MEHWSKGPPTRPEAQKIQGGYEGLAHLDSRQHNCRVDVLQARQHPLDDLLGVPWVTGVEAGEGIEDEDLLGQPQ